MSTMSEVEPGYGGGILVPESTSTCGLTHKTNEVLGFNAEGAGMEQVELLANVQTEFRMFAEWVFGPQGVSSLQFLAFGDFVCGKHNLILRRSGDEEVNFRVLEPRSMEESRVVDEYQDVLEACPITTLFTPGDGGYFQTEF
jgi:hypothetical protein